jgi:hypothetical protein
MIERIWKAENLLRNLLQNAPSYNSAARCSGAAETQLKDASFGRAEYLNR